MRNEVKELVKKNIGYGCEDPIDDDIMLYGFIGESPQWAHIPLSYDEVKYVMVTCIRACLDVGARVARGHRDTRLGLVTFYGDRPEEIAYNIYEHWLARGGMITHMRSFCNPVSDCVIGLCFTKLQYDDILDGQTLDYYVNLYKKQFEEKQFEGVEGGRLFLYEMLDCNVRFNIPKVAGDELTRKVIETIVELGARTHIVKTGEEYRQRGATPKEVATNILLDWKNNGGRVWSNMLSDLDGLRFEPANKKPSGFIT
ncbi:hypothetical protein AGMMS49941_05360 [Deferribacterales bacterium]|nr:hypothetical protein AGMMS49941_05360 [Deferribacterales bacterium]